MRYNYSCTAPRLRCSFGRARCDGARCALAFSVILGVTTMIRFRLIREENQGPGVLGRRSAWSARGGPVLSEKTSGACNEAAGGQIYHPPGVKPGHHARL